MESTLDSVNEVHSVPTKWPLLPTPSTEDEGEHSLIPVFVAPSSEATTVTATTPQMPRVVIVDPTPNPTPHPTPPATPGHRRHHPHLNTSSALCTHLGPASLVHSPKSPTKRFKPNFSIGSPNSVGQSPDASSSSSSPDSRSNPPSTAVTSPTVLHPKPALMMTTTATSKPPGIVHPEQPVNDLHAIEQQLVPKQGGKRMQLASDASDDDDYETTSDAESEWSTDEDEEASDSDSGPPPPPPPQRAKITRNYSQPHHPIPTSTERYAAAKERRKTGSMLNVHGVTSKLTQHLDEKELFAKKPKRTWSTGSGTGGLSMLMNPPPEVFPEGHPERQKSLERLARGWSSPAVSSTHRKPGMGGSGLTMTSMASPLPATTPTPAAAAAPAPSKAGPSRPPPRVPPVKRRSLPPPTRPPPGFIRTSSKLEALAPISASISASVSSHVPARRRSSGSPKKGRLPPADMEFSTDEETDAENKVDLSRSLAHEKLAAFLTKGKGKQRQQHQQQDSAIVSSPPTTVLASTTTTLASPTESVVLPTPSPTPVPRTNVSHSQFPYNLPAPADPSTPRTTRRLMLRTELSESLRQNLLWTRQQAHGPLSSAAVRRSSHHPQKNPSVSHLQNHASNENGALNQRHRVRSLVQLTPRRPGEAVDPVREEEMRRDREGLLRSRSGFVVGGLYHESGW
ncbi:hypothetical protein DL96DRAFT_1280250 [Flagelloscypha sp. PMI_526]|nr:hypothetical protein DL96DRAFT_1280250 [Flagelloscypha sp. PMI_526]